MTSETPHAPTMPPTGERMVPENTHPVTFWEHVYRYAFAARLARGRRVLDVACGEGYGSAALAAAGAASVIGVDIAEEACAHARRKYGVDARVGSGEQLPLGDGCVDLIVSFETLEHVPRPAAFLDECRRVLRPGGRIVISTPNKDVYGRRAGDAANPYHCSEMTAGEFTAALSQRFARVQMFGQRATNARWLSRQAASAERTPWARFRGFHFLQRNLRRWLEPSARTIDLAMGLGVSTAERTTVVDQILLRSRRWDNLLNPYTVRRQPAASPGADQVVYLIAVAERP